MRSLKLMLAAAVIAGSVLAPAAFAKKKRCPPGSDEPEYCQADPGQAGGHQQGSDRHRHHGHHHHHDDAFRHGDLVVRTSLSSGGRTRS